MDELRALNPNAPHAFAVHDAATLDWLIECDSSRDARRAAEIVVLRDSAPRHTGSLETITFVSVSPIPALALTLFLQALVDHAGDRLLRVKGLIKDSASGRRAAVKDAVKALGGKLSLLEQRRCVLLGRV